MNRQAGWHRHRSWLALIGGTFLALASAVIVAGLGPQAQVVCGTGHVFDRVAQKIMQPLGAGHIDGFSATYCIVPSTTAWLMSLVALVAVLAITLVLTRRATPASA